MVIQKSSTAKNVTTFRLSKIKKFRIKNRAGVHMIKLNSLILGLIILGLSAQSQTIEKAAIFIQKNTGQISNIKITIRDIAFLISGDGSLSYYMEDLSGRDFEERANPQGSADHGDVEYYDHFDRDEKRGKIKSIGNITIDYYDVFDREEKLGKVKSIGAVKVDYYDIFDREEKRGKIKSVGNIVFDYYDIFDSEEKLGKLKSVGRVNVNYFDRFDGAWSGKLKSIRGNSSALQVVPIQ